MFGVRLVLHGISSFLGTVYALQTAPLAFSLFVKVSGAADAGFWEYVTAEETLKLMRFA